ncbi:Pol protein [Phytophthora palmivora]|uniref:Pol protein n=1 Tax=Phytophthora palmivora TaxID=4796 RepID=A0A2P4Y5J2_9STRA|nr:Pol protein [Phytophthora palmivora]
MARVPKQRALWTKYGSTCIHTRNDVFTIKARKFTEILESYGVANIPNTTTNLQANGVVERAHRTINDKLWTENISNMGEWENCLFSVITTSHNVGNVTKPSSVRARYAVRLPKAINWQQQQQHKQIQIKRATERENESRLGFDNRPEELVTVSRSDQRAPKLQQRFDGPFRVFSIRNDGILVIDKGHYQEKIHMQRVKPFQSPTMGEWCAKPVLARSM